MADRQPCYSKEEFAWRGEEISESQVSPKVEAGNHNKIVAIDIENGDFEVDASEIGACDRLKACHPDEQLLCKLKYYNTSLLLNRYDSHCACYS